MDTWIAEQTSLKALAEQLLLEIAGHHRALSRRTEALESCGSEPVDTEYLCVL